MDLFAFDDDYVRRLRDRDARTEEHFHDYFHPLLRIKLRSRLRSADDVEDVCQDVFLRVLRALRSDENPLRDGRKLGAYVLGVCNNLLLERYRIDARTEPLDEQRHDKASAHDIESDLVTAENKQRVLRVLDELDARDSGILRAVFLNEEPKDEICGKFGVTREYLRVLLHRAKEHFRAAFVTKSGQASLPR